MLQAGSLPPRLSPIIAAAGGRAPAPASAAVLTLAEVERQALVHALEVADRNVAQAARSLGIGRATMHRKLKKYELAKA